VIERLDQQFKTAAVLSTGVAKIPRLRAFLPEIETIEPRKFSVARADCVLGWGHKKTAALARRQARKAGLPYLALEDGFIRSVGLGEAGTPPLGLVVDDQGIYYDATAPSRLEHLISTQPALTSDQDTRARALIDMIVQNRLSKTNLPAAPITLDDRPRVLVIDQTQGDASIELGLAGPSSFKAMIEAAHDENPGAEILLKRHPAVSAGHKQGCVDPGWFGDAHLLDQPVNTMALIEGGEKVYTVTSLTGFEALMRGKAVRTFGMPFYAGWGASTDELSCARRAVQRSVVEIFHASYLRYMRMIDPLTGALCPLEQALARLCHWRSRAEENQGAWAVVGIAPWKREPVRAYFAAPNSDVHFCSTIQKAEAHAKDGARIVVWAGREKGALAEEMAQSPFAMARLEDGFVRSRGLGSDFFAAGSMSLDDLGIYFDPSKPSRLETLLQETQFEPALLDRAARLRDRLIKGGISKYNLAPDQAELAALPLDQPVALVVGQVEDDASILRGTTDIGSDGDLLKAVRAACPDQFIVYKPHPDVVAGNRKGGASEAIIKDCADLVVERADIVSCLGVAHSLHTMTSLSGFEALLRGVPVHTYGGPFYAGWGLTQDRHNFARRTRRVSLDELVAAALILYPRYVDPVTRLPCTVEDLVGRIEAQIAQKPVNQFHRFFRAVTASLRLSPKVRY